MSNQIKASTHTLGEIVVKFEMPKQFIDDINNVFDEKEATTVDWTTQLAGKIKKEKLVNHLLSNDMKINKIEIVSQAETPGLGAKCTEPGFAEKYTGLGKEQLLVDKDGGTIKSITGATISTRAITESIKSAVEILSANIAPSAQGGKDE